MTEDWAVISLAVHDSVLCSGDFITSGEPFFILYLYLVDDDLLWLMKIAGSVEHN